MATRLDEGLEDFFSRRVMDESSRCGIQAHPPVSAGPEALEKLLCPPTSQGVFSSGSLSRTFPPTFSFFPTQPLIPMFSESP